MREREPLSAGHEAPAPGPIRWPALGILGAGGVLLGVLTFLVVVTSDHWPHREIEATLGALIVWSFVGAGLFARAQRPDNRFGLLLAAVGVTWFLTRLNASDHAVPFTIGGLLGGSYLAVSAHMLVAFPSGRLSGRRERLIVGLAYGILLLVVARMAVNDYSSEHTQVFGACPQCPDNLLLIDPQPDLAVALLRIQTTAGIVVSILALAQVAQRWRHATRPARRSLSAVIMAGLIVITAHAVYFLGRLLELSGGVVAALRVLALTALAAVPLAFLAGLARTRFFQGAALAQLIQGLRESEGRGRLRDAMAAALGDRSLDIAYWVPDLRRYVDASGEPVDLPPEDPRLGWTPIEHDGQRLAAITHDRALAEQPELVQATGAAAALALERERLHAELRAHVAELTASRARLVQAGDEERRRIERDLHDGAQQRLVAMLLNVKLARRGDDVTEPERARRQDQLLDGIERGIAEALDELRNLAHGILPPLLSDRGLATAVDDLAGRLPVRVEIEAMPDERLPGNVEVAAYFVIAEALTNAIKHADAGRIVVSARRAGDHVEIEVRDDGVGGVDAGAGTGLQGLRDRVGALNGRLSVDSPPGAGTAIRAEIPLPVTALARG
jgi:signal transduction histidine kinase